MSVYVGLRVQNTQKIMENVTKSNRFAPFTWENCNQSLRQRQSGESAQMGAREKERKRERETETETETDRQTAKKKAET